MSCLKGPVTERVPLRRPPEREWQIGCSKHKRKTCRQCLLPVTAGPWLIKTAKMVNWHRPKWATVDLAHPWVGLRFQSWCGYPIPAVGSGRKSRGERVLTASRVSTGERLCRLCEAYATNMGEPPTVIEPHVVLAVTFRAVETADAPCELVSAEGLP